MRFKILENATKAVKQLGASVVVLHCEVRIPPYVVNWFDQPIHLEQDEYQRIVNKLELDGDVASLKGIEGVWFITKMGRTSSS